MRENERGKILLESGTNEIEIMQFTINDNLYGINVAKVREIMMSVPVKHIPHVHEAVEGIFKPRDVVLTVVDLPFYLTGKRSEPDTKDLFIITNFNKMYIAFRVHTVVGISRISWTGIHKPDKTISSGDSGVATGIAQCDDKLVTVLDFEKIVADIAPETSIQMKEVENMGKREKRDYSVLIAEDSVLLANVLEKALHKAGYHKLKIFSNGQELWDYIRPLAQNPATLADNVSIVITDIEMPSMDGHRLTKLIKSDPVLSSVPVVIFSSLITEEMWIKGKKLGADDQMSKPEIGHLVDVMDALLEKREKNNK